MRNHLPPAKKSGWMWPTQNRLTLIIVINGLNGYYNCILPTIQSCWEWMAYKFSNLINKQIWGLLHEWVSHRPQMALDGILLWSPGCSCFAPFPSHFWKCSCAWEKGADKGLRARTQLRLLHKCMCAPPNHQLALPVSGLVQVSL